MLLTLEDAQKMDPDITELDLRAYEITVRQLTNNNFHNRNRRVYGLFLRGNAVSNIPFDVFKVGMTVEINNSLWNDGLYVVKERIKDGVLLDGEFTDETNYGAVITAVVYPPDVLVGVRNIIEYKVKTRDRIGVKSESVGRVSKTYYDANSSNDVEGVPSHLWSFLKKYRKIRWS